MTRFHVFTDSARAGLHVWRESAPAPYLSLHLPPIGRAQDGWVTFQADLDPANSSAIRFMLFAWSEEQRPVHYENDVFIRTLEREGGSFPSDVWLFQNSGEWTLTDPRLAQHPRVRVHLVTAKRFRQGLLYLWRNSEPGRKVPPTGETPSGPFWDLDLEGSLQSFFNFKFMRPDPEYWEQPAANRTWTSAHGAEIWVKSEAREIAQVEPQKQEALFRFRQGSSLPQPVMHLWQDSSDFTHQLTMLPDPANPDWYLARFPVYRGLRYVARFYGLDGKGKENWEDPKVRREFSLDLGSEFWMVEGNSAVLRSQPTQDVEVSVTVRERPPGGHLDGPLYAHVWLDRARTPLHQRLPVDRDGRVQFRTYSALTTSIRFYTDSNWEAVDRHALYPGEASKHPVAFITLDRFQPLWDAPPVPLYRDPPFHIRRPGVYEEEGFLHFVLHAGVAARVRLWGAWMEPGQMPVDLFCTRDRTFWWTRIPVTLIQQGLASGDYHGAEYHYLIDNDHRIQDPAASWVVNSNHAANSRLLRPDHYVWTTPHWERPSWDHLMIYQVHPAQFTARNQELDPLRRIAWEVDNPQGYFKQLGITALLLLPVNEFEGDWSWGYNPAFYYAVESKYGGPDSLKYLVDACHRNGIAVLLDLVFNHSGSDNPLWHLSRQAFFDGDTAWGAMVNYDHPQCRFFFARCVAYMIEEFRIDGIRLDHTQTILHGNEWVMNLVRERGSGGGWEFLRAIKDAALEKGGPNCLIVGEHLPNEWGVSRGGGPLDSQWNDNFHDCLEEAFRSDHRLGELADAYKISHTEAMEWFHTTNYGESHDEVGNEDDRIARIAGYGRGLRAAKVHAAAVLLSRGIPMFFMGAESAEWRRFRQITGSDPDKELPLASYLADAEKGRVRNWWRRMCELHRNPNFRGPAPLDIRFAQDRMLGFTRGMKGDYYVLLNFGGWVGEISLAALNLPEGLYRELWNSTWDEFRNASEGEFGVSNGGREARRHRGGTLRVAELTAIILERAG